jgi:hypothetical protein
MSAHMIEVIAQYGSLGLFTFLLALMLCCVFLGPEERP